LHDAARAMAKASRDCTVFDNISNAINRQALLLRLTETLQTTFQDLDTRSTVIQTGSCFAIFKARNRCAIVCDVWTAESF
jgi:hypothetical protein